MRKTYEKPFAEIAPLASQLMQEVNEPENSGTADQPWAKENDEVVEDEEASLVEKEAAPMAFSNNYLKKVWD
ncbi:MAG: hypothetical protein IKQ12_10410 [Prevotella sp.]|nr:hypothetical protein [Prevotella sp.]MBR6139957.1 hypothetical protein [Prevotella sp.]